MEGKFKPVNRRRMERVLPQIWDAPDLCEIINRHGNKVAFRYFENKKLRSMTYAEFGDKIRQTAAAFTAMGLVGERVAIIGDTSPQWLCSYIAALVAGCVAVPMDKELELSEIEKFFNMVEAKAVVYSKSFNEKFIHTITSPDTTIRYFIPIFPEYDTDYNHRVISFKEVLECGHERVENGGYDFPTADREALAEMLFTSGTTGTSKCVMLSQKNIFSVVNSAVQTVCFTKDDVTVSVLPVHHTYELACLQAEMVYGCEICINDSLRHVMRNFALFKPTALVLVPMFVNTMYKKIWAEAEKTHRAGTLRAGLATSRALMAMGIDARRKIFKSVIDAFGGRLDHVICGGARLDPQLIADFEDFGISIFEGFGITECAPLTNVTPYYARKYGSVGPAVPCCRVRIATEYGSGLNDRGYRDGELQVKGDNVMLGYYKNEEATAEAFTKDGWFRTGDIAYMDKDGYVYITGRIKSVIVLENGKNVFPEEIEEYLGHIDTIAECVVVGRKTPRSDEIALTAVVFPNMDKFRKDATTEEVQESIRTSINQLNRRLPAFKQIKAVEIRNTEFEKTTSKKIKRHLVK